MRVVPLQRQGLQRAIDTRPCTPRNLGSVVPELFVGGQEDESDSRAGYWLARMANARAASKAQSGGATPALVMATPCRASRCCTYAASSSSFASCDCARRPRMSRAWKSHRPMGSGVESISTGITRFPNAMAVVYSVSISLESAACAHQKTKTLSHLPSASVIVFRQLSPTGMESSSRNTVTCAAATKATKCRTSSLSRRQ
jgi:hypothetical protein